MTCIAKKIGNSDGFLLQNRTVTEALYDNVIKIMELLYDNLINI